MLSDDMISLRHLPRRSSKNCDLQFANTDRFKANYNIDERQQYVDIDGTPSNYNRILTGVPQGSILGPLLFIIYIKR